MEQSLHGDQPLHILPAMSQVDSLKMNNAMCIGSPRADYKLSR